MSGGMRRRYEVGHEIDLLLAVRHKDGAVLDEFNRILLFPRLLVLHISHCEILPQACRSSPEDHETRGRSDWRAVISAPGQTRGSWGRAAIGRPAAARMPSQARQSLNGAQGRAHLRGRSAVGRRTSGTATRGFPRYEGK